MKIAPEHLNLTFPHGWNECSREQLEQIASVLIERAAVGTRHQTVELKTALFFLFSGVRVVEPVNPRVSVEEQYYVCEHPNIKGRFNLYLWQLTYWLNGVPSTKKEGEKEVKGVLDWLDDDDAHPLLLCPYDQLRLAKRHRWMGVWWHWGRGKVFQGPPALMDGFTWQRYRFAQDYMSYFITQQNRLVKMQKYYRKYSQKEMEKQYLQMDMARAMFLATIFEAKVKTVDEQTGRTRHDFAYVSNQHIDNAQYFRGFPDVEWQVILIWWTGQMKDLQRIFPRCFKHDKVGGKQHNPLELYTRTTATMEKYLGLDEKKVNNESYRNVLQHLEDMSREQEELEKIKKKH